MADDHDAPLIAHLPILNPDNPNACVCGAARDLHLGQGHTSSCDQGPNHPGPCHPTGGTDG
jgi:hypothetical protein